MLLAKTLISLLQNKHLLMQMHQGITFFPYVSDDNIAKSTNFYLFKFILYLYYMWHTECASSQKSQCSLELHALLKEISLTKSKKATAV